MNYKKVFYDRSDDDLIDLLDRHEQMNLEAKYALKEIIRERNLAVDNKLMEELERDLQAEYEQVNSLGYVKYLGLALSFGENGSFIIKRSLAFKIANGVGIVVGLLLFFFMLEAFPAWAQLFEEGVSILGIVNASVLTIIGLFGLALFLKVLSRVLANAGFRLEKDGEDIRLVNIADGPRGTLEVTPDQLDLVAKPKEVFISLKLDGNEYKVLQSSGSKIHKDTIKKIYELIK